MLDHAKVAVLAFYFALLTQPGNFFLKKKKRKEKKHLRLVLWNPIRNVFYVTVWIFNTFAVRILPFHLSHSAFPRSYVPLPAFCKLYLVKVGKGISMSNTVTYEDIDTRQIFLWNPTLEKIREIYSANVNRKRLW